MICYAFTEIENTEIESIQKVLRFLCKENKINQERQKYKILITKEKILPKHNDVLFTSGSKKYLSFYGKIYLNKNSKIFETVYIDNSSVVIEPSINSLLIILGGVNNSTSVQEEEEVLSFYIAPERMLDLQDPEIWKDI